MNGKERAEILTLVNQIIKKETKENKKEEKKMSKAPQSDKPQMLNIEGIMAYPYTKEGDSVGFIRRRIIGQTVVNGKICQVNGFVTQRKGQ